MNIELQNIIVVAIVIGCVAVALVRTLRFYKKAKSGDMCCGCGSTGCKAKGKGGDELPECCRGEKSSTKKTAQ